MSANRFKIGDLVRWNSSNAHIGIVEGIGKGTTPSEQWCAVRWLNSNHIPFDKLMHYHFNNLEPYKDAPRGN